MHQRRECSAPSSAESVTLPRYMRKYAAKRICSAPAHRCQYLKLALSGHHIPVFYQEDGQNSRGAVSLPLLAHSHPRSSPSCESQPDLPLSCTAHFNAPAHLKIYRKRGDEDGKLSCVFSILVFWMLPRLCRTGLGSCGEIHFFLEKLNPICSVQRHAAVSFI
jgi:hypothetical protein